VPDQAQSGQSQLEKKGDEETDSAISVLGKTAGTRSRRIKIRNHKTSFPPQKGKKGHAGRSPEKRDRNESSVPAPVLGEKRPVREGSSLRPEKKKSIPLKQTGRRQERLNKASQEKVRKSTKEQIQATLTSRCSLERK